MCGRLPWSLGLQHSWRTGLSGVLLLWLMGLTSLRLSSKRASLLFFVLVTPCA